MNTNRLELSPREQVSFCNKKKSYLILISGILLLITAFTAICIGAYYIPFNEVVKILWQKISMQPSTEGVSNTIIFNIRITRIILAMAIGMSLSSSGAVYQGVFRNPLIEPYILGVSSGAAFGAALAILFKFPFSLGVLAFVFGMIAYVPQEHKPPFPYTVKEVVLMGSTPHMGGIFGPKPNDIKVAITAMDMVEITHLADRCYTHLSGGQRQLVLLARAFAQDTPLLLLDEPTSNLDYKNQLTIWNIIKKITRQGKTVMVCTHDPNHVFGFCDKVILVGREGSVLAEGTPQDVINTEVLDSIYGELCSIHKLKGKSIVIPNITENLREAL